MTENLSTGVSDEAGAQKDTGVDPPVAWAAKAISAIVTGAATSARSVNNPRLGMAQAPALRIPGGPQNASLCGSFPGLLPEVMAAPRGPT